MPSSSSALHFASSRSTPPESQLDVSRESHRYRFVKKRGADSAICILMQCRGSEPSLQMPPSQLQFHIRNLFSDVCRTLIRHEWNSGGSQWPKRPERLLFPTSIQCIIEWGPSTDPEWIRRPPVAEFPFADLESRKRVTADSTNCVSFQVYEISILSRAMDTASFIECCLGMFRLPVASIYGLPTTVRQDLTLFFFPPASAISSSDSLQCGCSRRTERV